MFRFISMRWSAALMGAALLSAAPPADAAGRTATTVTIARRTAPAAFRPAADGATTLTALQWQRIYTSRPLLAVGTLEAVDTAASSVTLAVDRRLSLMPHIMEVRARREGVLEAARTVLFPPRRTFALTPRTMLIDARGGRHQVPATSGRIDRDPQRVPLSAFRPGMRVGVIFQIRPDPRTAPLVKTLSILDPRQASYELDFNPARRFRLDRKGGGKPARR